jgi:hypothetical protein
MRLNVKRIVGFALKNPLPSMYGNRGSVDAGGLMSYAADLADSDRRVAYYVDRNLPLLLLQLIKWFVKFSCPRGFLSGTAIFDPRKQAMERIEIETHSLYNARKEFRL